MEFKLLLNIFSDFILIHEKYCKINNPIFLEIYKEKYLDLNKVKSIRLRIARILEEEEKDSIRKSEEICHNIFLAEEFFSLKQKIASIDNFIILYNERSKFYLFKYWIELEKKGYDPVFEHNKSLELFEMHYNLNDSQFFMLNIQLSRFFKELSEFECHITPSFRHPFLKSKIVHNNVIIEDCGQQDLKVERVSKLSDSLEIDIIKFNFGIFSEYYQNFTILYEEELEKKEFLKKTSELGSKTDKKLLNYLEEIGLLSELIAINIYGSGENKLKIHETLNIEINSNKFKFLSYFEDIIKQKKMFKCQNNKNKKEYDFELEETESMLNNSKKLSICKNEKKSQNDEITTMINNIDLSIKSQKVPILYYYKRWIWMNFPFICLSNEKIDFSILMKHCFSEDEDYLSYLEELSLYCKSLEIINKLKKKKTIVLEQKKINLTNSVENLPKEVLVKPCKENKQKDFYLNNGFVIKKKNFSQSLINTKSEMQNSLQKGDIYKKNESGNFRKTVNNSVFNINNKENNNKLFFLINKYQSKENSVVKNYKKKLDNLLNNRKLSNKNPINFENAVLNFENDIFCFREQKLEIILKKNLEMKKKIDKLNCEKEDLKENIKRLKTLIESTNGDIMKKKLNLEFTQKKQKSILKYKSKIEIMNHKLNIVKAEKKRYLEIIDVCLINQTENEDQIRNLNFYLKNLKKIIKSKKIDFMTSKKEIAEKKNLISKLYEDYKKRKLIKEKNLDNFRFLFSNERVIDKNIFNANQAIKNIINKDLQNQFNKNIIPIKVDFLNKNKMTNSNEFSDLFIQEQFYEDFKLFFEEKESFNSLYPFLKDISKNQRLSITNDLKNPVTATDSKIKNFHSTNKMFKQNSFNLTAQYSLNKKLSFCMEHQRFLNSKKSNSGFQNIESELKTESEKKSYFNDPKFYKFMDNKKKEMNDNRFINQPSNTDFFKRNFDEESKNANTFNDRLHFIKNQKSLINQIQKCSTSNFVEKSNQFSDIGNNNHMIDKNYFDENTKKNEKMKYENKKIIEGYENFNSKWFLTKKFQNFLYLLERRKRLDKAKIEILLKIEDEKKKEKLLNDKYEEIKLINPNYLKEIGKVLIKLKEKNENNKNKISRKSYEKFLYLKNQQSKVLQELKLGLQPIFKKLQINIDSLDYNQIKTFLKNENHFRKLIQNNLKIQK